MGNSDREMSRSVGKSRTESVNFGQNEEYRKYDTFVGVCIGQLVIGLVGLVIACWLLFEKSVCSGDDDCTALQQQSDVSVYKTDAIAAASINLIISLLALMGISVAASELPLAFRKRETLLDVMKMDALFKRAAKLQKAYVWLSLAMAGVTYGILFNYINGLLHNIQQHNLENGIYMKAALILYLFYFIQFALCAVIVVANRAIIVAAFNKHVMPVSEQVKRDDYELNNRDDDVFNA